MSYIYICIPDPHGVLFTGLTGDKEKDDAYMQIHKRSFHAMMPARQLEKHRGGFKPVRALMSSSDPGPVQGPMGLLNTSSSRIAPQQTHVMHWRKGLSPHILVEIYVRT